MFRPSRIGRHTKTEILRAAATRESSYLMTDVDVAWQEAAASERYEVILRAVGNRVASSDFAKYIAKDVYMQLYAYEQGQLGAAVNDGSQAFLHQLHLRRFDPVRAVGLSMLDTLRGETKEAQRTMKR